MVKVAGPQLFGSCSTQAGGSRLIETGNGVGDGVGVGVSSVGTAVGAARVAVAVGRGAGVFPAVEVG